MVLISHAGPSLSGPCNLIEFKSNKSKRVCTSTMHAEAVSHMTAQEHTAFIQTYVYELDHPGTTALKILDLKGSALSPVVGITDCDDLHAALTSAAAPNPSNKSLTLYLAALRELRELQRIQEYVWCDTRDMLANSLTKIEADGTCPVAEVEEFLRTFVLKFTHPYKWGTRMTEE